MISTKETGLLPDSQSLQQACKAMAVLDAIFCQEWEYRYSSYNCEWAEGEEFFEMRNGEGAQLLILFKQEGTVINGFSSEAEEAVDKEKLSAALPATFHEFIFGEPVNSIGTTFCLWKSGNGDWHTAAATTEEEYSEELLSPLDAEPATYIKWASDYFMGSYRETGIPLQVVTSIFNQEPLSREMVLALVDTLEDWDQLLEDLAEISYPHHISS